MPKLSQAETYRQALQELVDAVELERRGDESEILGAIEKAIEVLVTVVKKPKAPPVDKAHQAIQREALKLAKAKVKEQLVAKGYDPKTLPTETLTAFATQLVAKDPYFLVQAVQRRRAADPQGSLPLSLEPQP